MVSFIEGACSETVLIFKSEWSEKLDTYGGALEILRRLIFWRVWILLRFYFFALPQSWRP